MIFENLTNVRSLHSVVRDPNLLQPIQEKIKSKKGILPVLIHPFFEEFFGDGSFHGINNVLKSLRNAHNFPERKSRFRNRSWIQIDDRIQYLHSEGFMLRLVRFLKAFRDDPILIGEENKHIPTTLALLYYLGHRGDKIFYRTDKGNPIPLPGTGTWSSLSSEILLLQPELVIVAGQLLDFLPDTFPLLAWGCVPLFVNKFQHELPVNKPPRIVISPISKVWHPALMTECELTDI